AIAGSSKGAPYPLISKIPESYAAVVNTVPWISFATPVTLALLRVASAEALTAGVVPAQLRSLLNYSMVAGTMITSNQTGILAIGKALSATIGKGAGDPVQLNGAMYSISGVYLTNSWMDYSAIIPHLVAKQMIGMVNVTWMIVATARDSQMVTNLLVKIST